MYVFLHLHKQVLYRRFLEDLFTTDTRFRLCPERRELPRLEPGTLTVRAAVACSTTCAVIALESKLLLFSAIKFIIWKQNIPLKWNVFLPDVCQLRSRSKTMLAENVQVWEKLSLASWRGCRDCRDCRPRLPTEIAGRDC